MALFSRFVKNIEPRRFTYETRFYDAEKEDLENRLARLKNSQGKDVDAMKLRIADGLKMRHSGNREWKSKLTRRSNMRLVLILGILMIMVLILLGMYWPLIEKYLQ